MQNHEGCAVHASNDLILCKSCRLSTSSLGNLTLYQLDIVAYLVIFTPVHIWPSSESGSIQYMCWLDLQQ